MDDIPEDRRPYTRRQWFWAVNLAAVLGWTGFCVGMIVDDPRVFGMLPLMAIFGLPISFAACWLIGAPVLARLMRRPIGWRRAALWGGGIAGLIAALSIVIGRVRGFLQFLDPGSYSQIGGGEYVRSIDGILTPYGWWVLAQDTALFVLLGSLVGLGIRAVIDPGRPEAR